MSDAGACLQVEGTDWLPGRFDLRIPIDGTKLTCRIIWRSSDRIGVAFENALHHGQGAAA
jgi:hypothetical protein